MKKNMNSIDRVVRLLIAAVIGVLLYMNILSGALGYVLLAIAIIFALTSFVSFCPLYSVFKLSTYKKSE